MKLKDAEGIVQAARSRAAAQRSSYENTGQGYAYDAGKVF